MLRHLTLRKEKREQKGVACEAAVFTPPPRRRCLRKKGGAAVRRCSRGVCVSLIYYSASRHAPQKCAF